MNRLTYNDAERILDEVISEYEANHCVIFRDESDRKCLHFGQLQRRLRAWKRSKTCIVSDCTSPSVPLSHSIPKSLSLNLIAEQGHLLTPELDHSTGLLDVARVGLSRASTFPGFCRNHEQLFGAQEKTESLTNERSVLLQIYRTICREIVRIRHWIGFLAEDFQRFSERRDAWIADRLTRELEQQFPASNPPFVKSVSVSHDPILKILDARLDCVRSALRELEESHLPQVLAALENKVSAEFDPNVVVIDVMIPVALSGMGTFHLMRNGVRRSVLALLNVLPYHGKTQIILAGRHEDTSHIHEYMDHWRHPLRLISMIETWMIHGTDHWFIQPSTWESLPINRQRRILDSILDTTRSVGEESCHSIFDELRRSLIEVHRMAIPESPSMLGLRKLLQHEGLKLAAQPTQDGRP